MDIKQMVTPSKSAIRALYFEIPVDAYKFISIELGYKHPGTIAEKLSGRDNCTMNFYNRIQDAYKLWLKHVQFSTKNKNGVFDFEQTRMYYKGLISLMNSEEYILLPSHKRDLMIEEQKKIYKQLNN